MNHVILESAPFSLREGEALLFCTRELSARMGERLLATLRSSRRRAARYLQGRVAAELEGSTGTPGLPDGGVLFMLIRGHRATRRITRLSGPRQAGQAAAPSSRLPSGGKW